MRRSKKNEKENYYFAKVLISSSEVLDRLVAFQDSGCRPSRHLNNVWLMTSESFSSRILSGGWSVGHHSRRGLFRGVIIIIRGDSSVWPSLAQRFTILHQKGFCRWKRNKRRGLVPWSVIGVGWSRVDNEPATQPKRQDKTKTTDRTKTRTPLICVGFFSRSACADD